MDLILLAGNGSHNKAWIYEVSKTLAPLFDNCLVHDYEHWQNNEANINFDAELAKLRHETEGIGEYVIFAKSIGSVLTFMGVNRGILKPKTIIITGLPLGMIEEEHIPMDDWLRHSDIPLLFIQNTEDPLGSFKEVEKYLSGIIGNRKYTLAELDGNTHNYNDLLRLKEEIASFRNQAQD